MLELCLDFQARVPISAKAKGLRKNAFKDIPECASSFQGGQENVQLQSLDLCKAFKTSELKLSSLRQAYLIVSHEEKQVGVKKKKKRQKSFITLTIV